MSRTVGCAIFRQYNVTKRKILVERLYHSTTCDTPEGYYIPYQQRKSQSPLSDMSKVKTLDASNLLPAIQKAVDSLRSGNIIALPTDTIYGIAGLAQSTSAVRKIYAVKGRDLTKPISISVGDVEDVLKWGKVTISEALLKELLPGPVTVVFERLVALNPELNPGTTLVGIRVPDHGFIREVSRLCGEPLALTSANVSSHESTLSVQEFEHLWSHLDLVFDGGRLGTTPLSKKGSTVVDLSKKNVYTVIREGSAFNSTVSTLERHGLREDRKL